MSRAVEVLCPEGHLKSSRTGNNPDKPGKRKKRAQDPVTFFCGVYPSPNIFFRYQALNRDISYTPGFYESPERMHNFTLPMRGI